MNIAALVLAMATAGWPYWGGDPGGARFSDAAQINRTNVAELREVWRYHTGELGQNTRDRRLTFEATPVLWQGRLYITTAYGTLHVIDAVSGKAIWQFDPAVPRDVAYGDVASRGVSLWHSLAAVQGRHCAHRVIWGTLAGQVLAVDAIDGRPCADFGKAGRIDLREAIGGRLGRYAITSPPALIGDLAVFGSAIADNGGIDVERGIVRAIDVRSGREVWRFDPIPRSAADPARATWGGDAATRYGGANAWAPLSVDPERGLVFVPTTSPAPDFYGGGRPGDNRYANSVVALDTSSGRIVWQQQLVHHDVWDYDLPAQPVLTDITRGGARHPVVLQATKTGFVFTFHRATGEPFWPIREVPVPGDGAPGEVLSPTQPIPSRPPPLTDRSRITPDDAWGLLLFDKWACRRLIESARSDGPFTPPTTRGTIMNPSWAGGLNWGGLSIDPKRQYAFAFAMKLPGIVRLIPRTVGSLKEVMRNGPDGEYNRMRGTPYYMYRQPLLSPLGVPCVAPPWGQLVAIDLAAGDIAWSVPVGGPADLAPIWLPPMTWGMPGIGGPLATAGGVVFMGAVLERRFRAFDADTGALLWQAPLPFGGQANPMSYEVGGRQFVVIAAGGHTTAGMESGDVLVAFALPERIGWNSAFTPAAPTTRHRPPEPDP